MTISTDLVAAHEPWITPDLQDYLEAIGGMFAQVELYTEGEEAGWSILFDADLVPIAALPHLAMYVGERLPAGLSELLAREWVKDAPNQVRGTLYSIFRAAQRKLTGQRTVQITERIGAGGAHVDRITVHTYVDETPDPVGTERDIREMVPADIVLTYATIIGQVWLDVDTTYTTWADVDAAYATWEEMRADVFGWATFTRPIPT